MTLSRRSFLRASAASAAGLALGAGAHLHPGVAAAANTGGTTLAQVGVPGAARRGGYRPLVAGGGWPLVVRQDLAGAGAAREGARTALASFVQLTDMHITDVQSPARFEYTHDLVSSSAFRPHEALNTQGAVALVKRINAVASGPFTGRRFDCVVTTGDNTDNREVVELDWFQRILSGGSITPNTGARGRFEGVQELGSTIYYRPETDSWDIYKDKGFIQIPGLLRAAISTHSSPGLNTPWYAVFGNHDDQFLGTIPNNVIDWMYLWDRKLDLPVPSPAASAVADALTRNPAALGGIMATQRASGPVFDVTADARRRPFSNQEFVRRHFDPALTGPGPRGHGFTDPDGPTWYRFQIAPGVLGYALNTCNSLGLSNGSISQRQLDWLEGQLRAHRDQLALVFSHHTSKTMTAMLPNPETPGEAQYDGQALVARLLAHRNVVAWVNGHTHTNEMIPHRGADAKHSFWEINTASHIDFPQLARIIEITDNRDGTLSLFTPMIEADSPYTADPSDLSPRGLASLYRELSYNDIHQDDALLGSVADRNCELLLTHPLR